MSHFIKDENGQGMVEYALLIGLVAVVTVFLIAMIGTKLKDIFSKTNKSLNEDL
ncbi:MAG: Flp family type IVb pilin [Eubacterium sp.]|nr:Flp family type IVb pilin [Eubacterium sp.]